VFFVWQRSLKLYHGADSRRRWRLDAAGMVADTARRETEWLNTSSLTSDPAFFAPNPSLLQHDLPGANA